MRYTIYAKGFYCFPSGNGSCTIPAAGQELLAGWNLPARVFIRRLSVLADFGIRKLCSYITSGRRVSAGG